MASMGKTVLILVVLAVMVSGCTLSLDNPFVKKEQPEMKLVRERIAAYELIEREAELIHSIQTLKQATSKIQAAPPVLPKK